MSERSGGPNRHELEPRGLTSRPRDSPAMPTYDRLKGFRDFYPPEMAVRREVTDTL